MQYGLTDVIHTNIDNENQNIISKMTEIQIIETLSNMKEQ